MFHVNRDSFEMPSYFLLKIIKIRMLSAPILLSALSINVTGEIHFLRI